MGKVKKHHYSDIEITEEERLAMADYDIKKEAEIKERLEKVPVKEDKDYMNANFVPFEDRILVYPDPVEVKTAGGLYVPDEAVKKAKPLSGVVVEFGPGKNNLPLPLVKGMKIYYGNYAGTEIELDNKIKYLIMRMADCFGKGL